MANEITIVSGEAPHRWDVDADGSVTFHDEGPCAIWIDDSQAITKAQADAIREIIVECRAEGELDDMPKEGVQYPSFKIVKDAYKHCAAYLRCWTDECDEDLATQAWLGESTEVEWSDPKPPTAPVYEWVAGEPVLPEQQPAAGEEEEPQGEEEVEVYVDAEDIPGQVTCREGDEGDEVADWQLVVNPLIEVLADNGLDTPDLLEVDGVFGPKTVEATAFVQEVMGVEATGACDQVTWHMILSQ